MRTMAFPSIKVLPRVLLLLYMPAVGQASITIGDPVPCFSATNEYVYKMAEDKFIPGNILYAIKLSLWTTDGHGPGSLIAGGAEQGYQEGDGAVARFNSILGFIQKSDSAVLVIDKNNHCIRMIDRKTNTTSQFAGTCKKRGTSNGVGGLFTYPSDIIQDARDSQIAYISEFQMKACIRSLNLDTKEIKTVICHEYLRFPQGLAFSPVNENHLLIAFAFALTELDLQNLTVRVIAGGLLSEKRDGDFDHSMFDNPRSLLSIPSKQAVLVADVNANAVRLVDYNRKMVSTLFQWNTFAVSLMKIGQDLYVGSDYEVNKLQLSGIENENFVVKISGTTTSAWSTDTKPLLSKEQTSDNFRLVSSTINNATPFLSVTNKPVIYEETSDSRTYTIIVFTITIIVIMVIASVVGLVYLQQKREEANHLKRTVTVVQNYGEDPEPYAVYRSESSAHVQSEMNQTNYVHVYDEVKHYEERMKTKAGEAGSILPPHYTTVVHTEEAHSGSGYCNSNYRDGF